MSSLEPTILLVEGKSALSQSLSHYLAKAWQNITIVHSSSDALAQTKTIQPHIIVFDASTMRSNGIRTCARLRKQNGRSPLIYCYGDRESCPEGLEADICLARPFTARKLLNRLRILLPAEDREDEIVKSANLTLYLRKKSVVVGGVEHSLNPKLTDLLALFMRRPGETISRRELMEQVWETSYVGDTRTLDVHIRWIRKMIEVEPKSPQRLTTTRGVGYTFQDR